MPRGGFYRIVTEAINDILEHGFDSEQRITDWVARLSRAARESLVPTEILDRHLQQLLTAVFARSVKREKLVRVHNGVSEFTLQQVQPRLRAELDRRIRASANLIKLNREEAISNTMRRFAGWATSVPAGGTEVAKHQQVREEVRRGIAGLPYRERFVITDQGHKLTAAVNQIVAEDGGAIAFIWHHVDEGPPAYDSRPNHVARAGKIFVLRDNWALKAGLMKLAGRQYYDQITAAAEEPNCRCWVEALYTLRDLESDMLTEKGREKLIEARKQTAAFSGAMIHAA